MFRLHSFRHSVASFQSFGLSPSVQLALARSGIFVPTAAQNQAIPRLLSGENLFLVSQTGRGKTLAYLIPMIEKLDRSDTQKNFPLPGKPRAVIVVPSRELAAQVTNVIKRMFVGQSAMCLGEHSPVKERRLLSGHGVDILVGTPAKFASLLGPDIISLRECQMVVIDEADTLNESESAETVKELIMKKINKTKCQSVIVGATRTSGANEFVKSVAELGVVMASVVTTDAHLTVPQVQQQFVPVGRRTRTAVLGEVIFENFIPNNSKIIVFVNSVRTCNFLSRFIAESPDTFAGIVATSLHGSLPPKIRKSNFKAFSTDPKINLLVCTDLASRGMDIPTDHVVMYDFPNTLADYLHRAGRTARAGQQGRVTALVTKKNLELVNQVKEAARAGVPIQWQKQPVAATRVRRPQSKTTPRPQYRRKFQKSK